MKNDNHSGNIVHKEIVIIGNGPSGIALSFMLSGHIPYIVSADHPDEMLSARLKPFVGKCLLYQDLENLSSGLEGRTTNSVSLLVDALLQPYADAGFELEPLVKFRKNGKEFDHIVLGKGAPGGSWHRMDPQILTLSLGNWMALPGLKFHDFHPKEKRATASSVANYYVQYTEKMGLNKYFKNNVTVTALKSLDIPKFRRIKRDSWVDTIDQDLNFCIDMDFDDAKDKGRSCFISDAIDCLMLNHRKKRNRCKRSREQESNLILPKSNRSSISLCCDPDNHCDNYSIVENSKTLRYSSSLDAHYKVPFSCECEYSRRDSKWLIEATDQTTGETFYYSCKYLVLANGGSDLPNRLEVSNRLEDPDWLVYDLRSLEEKLDHYVTSMDPEHIDPVLVVGAGLSAADAVIAVRGRNIPVLHVFRNKSPELHKQLPENLYPEYHKVHQMMTDGGSTYPLYTAYPGYNINGFDKTDRFIILTSTTGEELKVKVSFAAVFIGSRPDLSFLPHTSNLGIDKNAPLDCKTNTVDIDPLTYRVRGYENLFAIGPLAGDNFVRFLPGGALAVVSELYRKSEAWYGSQGRDETLNSLCDEEERRRLVLQLKIELYDECQFQE